MHGHTNIKYPYFPHSIPSSENSTSVHNSVLGNKESKIPSIQW